MESINTWIEQNVGRKLRVDPLNEIHLPSFVLGCSVMITISLLGPFMKMFVGGILLTVITLIKYIVIIGGITACVLILGTKNRDGHLVEQPQGAIKEPKKVKRDSKPVAESKGEVDLAKDDFEQIKYFDIAKTKSQGKRYPEENAYNKFINRAVFKEAS